MSIEAIRSSSIPLTSFPIPIPLPQTFYLPSMNRIPNFATERTALLEGRLVIRAYPNALGIDEKKTLSLFTFFFLYVCIFQFSSYPRSGADKIYNEIGGFSGFLAKKKKKI